MNNFDMNFKFIYGVEFCENLKKDLIETIINAEKNARINPFNSMASSRRALEALIKGIVVKNGHSINNYNLDKLVKICLNNGYISESLTENINIVRKSGNQTVHVNFNANTTPLYTTSENIKKSVDVLKNLFIICREYFKVDYEFDAEKIPFGEYYINRAVKKTFGEIIYGNYNYFVYKGDGYNYFLQRFPLSSDDEFKVLVTRSEESRSAIRESSEFETNSYLPVMGNIETSETCDHRLVTYKIPKNSSLLSEFEKTNLSKKKIIKIALDLLYALQEMKEIGNGIHHRNINPGCVIVSFDELGKKCRATLVNMQMTKIVNCDKTIIHQLSRMQTNNPFQPADIRNLTEEQLSRTNWEKVDVYSVAKIILYCIDRNLASDDAQEDSVVEKLYYKNFSDDFVELLTRIVSGDTNSNPNIEEMIGVLVNELKNSEQNV